MTEKQDVLALIKRICTETLGYSDLRDDEDFFERGASSLTIVELQLQIEEVLGWKVPTKTLLLDSSMSGWARAYLAESLELAAASS